MASLQLIYHDHSACPKITHMRFTLTNVQTTSGDDEKGKKKFLLIACHQTLQPVKQWSSFSQDHQLWARAKSPLQYVNERTMSKNTHFITPGGTRTHNLWIRSPTPYPLGHRGCVFVCGNVCVCNCLNCGPSSPVSKHDFSHAGPQKS